MSPSVTVCLITLGLSLGSAYAIEAVPPPDLDSASAPPVRPRVFREVAPFRVQAWAFSGQHGEIYVRNIQIVELGNYRNSIGQSFGPTFSVQNLTLPTAHPQHSYQVNITWSNGSRYSNWYRLTSRYGRTVMVQTPD